MSTIDIFGSSKTISSSNTVLGTRLSNVKNTVCPYSQNVISVNSDDTVNISQATSFGLSLLATQDLNSLVSQLNQGDTALTITDAGVGQIDVKVDTTPVHQWKQTYSQCLVELQTKVITPITDLGYDVGTSSKRYNNVYCNAIRGNTTGRVSIGDGAGTAGTSSVNIGYNAGGGTPDYSISMGRGANISGHTRAVAIGYASGQYGNTIVDYPIAIGFQAGSGVSGSTVNQMKTASVAVGYQAGIYGLGNYSIAIGASSATGVAGTAVKDSAVSIGVNSAKGGQGTASIAIGASAGETTCDDNTIILNASGTALNSTGTSRFFVNPIRSGGTGNNLVYDAGTKEVQVGGIASMAGLTVSGSIGADINNSRDIGSAGTKFATVYATNFNGNASSSNSSLLVNFLDSRYGTLTRPTSTIAEFRAKARQEYMELCEAGASNTWLGVGNNWGVSKTIIPWQDPSGGRMYQWFHSSNGIIYFRKSDQATPTESWGSWKDVSPDKCILTDSTDTITGTKTFASNILSDSTPRDIGSSSAKFNKLWTSDIDVSNCTGFKCSGNITPSVNNQGNIGVSSATQFLGVYAQNVYANGVVLTSDRRLKTDIQQIESGLETVIKLRPVQYKMKDKASDRIHTGFIAQEIKDAYDGKNWAGWVEQKDDFKTQSIQYFEIIALNSRAIQQLNERLTSLEKKKVSIANVDLSPLTEDMTQIYERLDQLESKSVSPLGELPLDSIREAKPVLHRCIEVSRFNEMYDRLSALESNESKGSTTEDTELIHNLLDRVSKLESKLASLPKNESKNEILESDGGISMNEILQNKNYELEQRLIKLEKQNKKLVSAVNRLLKSNDV